MEKLENYEMYLPSYSIGDRIYDKIPEICLPFGKKAVIIGGKTALSVAEDKIRKAINQSEIVILDTLWYGGGACTYENVEALRKNYAYKECDMVFAVGGGTAIDTCKCLALADGKPIFTFPTIASNCAACTNVAIMYNADGTFLKPHFFLKPANHAFINTEIICNAPTKYMWAGMGDTYAKYYEADVSSRGVELNHYTAMGVAASRMCVDPIVKNGAKALEDNKNHKLSHEFEETVLAIVVSTGIASIFLTRDHTPDYNSGLAHAIFYALTSLPQIEREHLHGEVVGFGVLILLLCDNQAEEFAKILRFNFSVGLPVCLDDIGVTREEFEKLIPVIPAMSDLNRYPYKVTEQMLRDALDKLNKIN